MGEANVFGTPKHQAVEVEYRIHRSLAQYKADLGSRTLTNTKVPADGTYGWANLVAEQCCENGGLDQSKFCVEVARLKTRIFERIMSWLDLGCLDDEESKPVRW